MADTGFAGRQPLNSQRDCGGVATTIRTQRRAFPRMDRLTRNGQALRDLTICPPDARSAIPSLPTDNCLFRRAPQRGQGRDKHRIIRS
jgi:hypothetical protein